MYLLPLLPWGTTDAVLNLVIIIAFAKGHIEHTSNHENGSLGNQKRMKTGGSNSGHSIHPQGQRRKRVCRTTSLAAAIDFECDVPLRTPSLGIIRQHPISIFAELRGHCARPSVDGKRTGEHISIVDALNGNGTRAVSISQDDMIDCDIQSDSHQHVGLTCKLKQDVVSQ